MKNLTLNDLKIKSQTEFMELLKWNQNQVKGNRELAQEQCECQISKDEIKVCDQCKQDQYDEDQQALDDRQEDHDRFCEGYEMQTDRLAGLY